MYSNLSDAEIERLAKLAEECAEVIQVVGKILVHGWENTHPRNPEQGTNRDHLEEELGNVANVVEMMVTAKDVSVAKIDDAAEEKRATIGKYLHHQEGL